MDLHDEKVFVKVNKHFFCLQESYTESTVIIESQCDKILSTTFAIRDE